MRRGTLPHAAILVLLFGVYFLTGKLGLRVAIVHPSASAVWAPTGVALAALLTLGYRVWPAILAGAFLVNVTTAGSIATSLGIAAGNTLEGLVGAYLVTRFANGRNSFERAQDTFRFAFLVGMVSTAVSATLGVTSLSLGGYARWADFGSIWVTWWLGDMGGALVVTPLLLLWTDDRRLRWTRAQIVEGFALLIALVAVGQAVFGQALGMGGLGHPLAFLCMPILVWAAFRFDPRFASAAIVVLAALAVRGTLSETGPLERWQMNASLVTLQVFMGVAAVTTLALAAEVSVRRRVEQAMRGNSERLREAMTELEAFSHSISHDLRSPVGAVLNYSAVIEEDFGARLDAEGIRLLRRIRSSAEAAESLLDQLVQIGWVGREKGEEGPTDMTALARDVFEEILAAGEEAGQVHFEIRDLPPSWGRAELLRCAFRNLLSNAIKYTRGRAERHVEMSGMAGDAENTYCVTDNGTGFDPRLGDAVFKPFRHLPGGRKHEGSGLGLAIVAKIIHRHRGRVWADSDGSSWARFCFTLPSRKNGHDADR